MVDRVKIFVISRLVTLQIVVDDSHTVCKRACRKSHFEGSAGPIALEWGAVDAPATCYYPTCIIIPKFVALGQTVWESR